MSVDERSRLQLAEALKRTLGPDEGITLMELLPPVGWADVATKHDLLMLEGRVDARFESLEGRMDARFESFEARMDARFERMDARFDRIEDRFLALDGRFETFEHKILGTMEHDFARLTMKLFAIYGATVCAMLGAVVALVKL